MAISCGPTQKIPQPSKEELFLGLEPISESEELKKEIQELKDKIFILESKAFSSEITNKLQGDTLLGIEEVASRYAHLDLTTKEYSTIATTCGLVFVSCHNVEPYLDGQKIIIRLGNPSYAAYSDTEIKATWGKKMARYGKDTKKWSDQLREKKISMTKEIPPGKWVFQEIVLSPATVEDLEYLSISVNPTSVKMEKPEPLEENR